MQRWIWHLETNSLKSFSTGFELSIRCVSDLFLLLSGLCFSFLTDCWLTWSCSACCSFAFESVVLMKCLFSFACEKLSVWLCCTDLEICFTDVPQKWLSFSQLRLIVLVFVVGLRGIWGRRGGIYDVLAWRAPWPPVLENVNCFCCRPDWGMCFQLTLCLRNLCILWAVHPRLWNALTALCMFLKKNTSKQESHSFEKICHSLVELEKSRMCDWVGLCLLFVEPHVIGVNLPLRFPRLPSFGFFDLSTPPTHRLYDKDYAI